MGIFSKSNGEERLLAAWSFFGLILFIIQYVSGSDRCLAPTEASWDHMGAVTEITAQHLMQQLHMRAIHGSCGSDRNLILGMNNLPYLAVLILTNHAST